MARTATEIQAELDGWYAARIAAQSGSSLTIATSAGSRTLTRQNLEEISKVIDQLERQLAAAQSGSTGHSFAVANFNHERNK